LCVASFQGLADYGEILLHCLPVRENPLFVGFQIYIVIAILQNPLKNPNVHGCGKITTSLKGP